MAGKRFNQQVSGRVASKPAAQYAIVGQPVPRLDIPAKVAGETGVVERCGVRLEQIEAAALRLTE